MNRFKARVESCEPGETLAWLRVEGGRVATRLWPGIERGERVVIRIRPEDVLLSAGHPGRISARNLLPGHVRSIKTVPEGAYITLDVGFQLTALITRAAVKQLGIRRRSALFAMVKATAIFPEATVPRRFKVALVGARGDVSPAQVELLRTIDQTGSMSAAAKELRITYRTAWLWVRAINRAWGSPLVSRIRGGRGGGGASLTPEGRAALQFASSVMDSS